MATTKKDWSYMEAIKTATHVYVGRAECGCAVAVVTDVEHPRGKKETAKDVADFLKSGLSIEHMTLDHWRKIEFGHKCGGAAA